MVDLGNLVWLVLRSVGFVVAILVVILIAKIIYDCVFWAFYKRNPHEALFSKDNPVLGLSFTAYLASVLIGTLTGVGSSGSYLMDLVIIFNHGLVTILVLLASWFVNEFGILRKVNNVSAIYDKRNMSVGIVEASSFVATSLVLSGSWTSGSWGAVILWFVVGQLMLIAGSLIYEWLNSANVAEEVEIKDNAAVALALGGFILATGWIVKGAVTGPAEAGYFFIDLLDAVIYLVVGMAMICLARKFTSRVVMRSGIKRASDMGTTCDLDDEQVAQKNCNAGWLEAAVYVLTAAAFTTLAL